MLNLLQSADRYGIVLNTKLNAEIRGQDLKNLPAFMDGDSEINLSDVVKESTSEDGRSFARHLLMK